MLMQIRTMLNVAGNRWQGAGAAAALMFMAAPVFGQPVGELVGWNSARFFPSEEASAQPRPSLAFFRKPERTEALPEGFALVPRWSAENGRTIATLDVPVGASLYGLGRAAGGLVREQRRYHTDEAAPWIMGVREDGTAFGVMLDSTWGAEVTVKAGALEIATGDPAPALLVFDLGSAADVIIEVNARTGGIEMPPLWALGIQVSASLRGTHPDLPADGVWIDCPHLSGEDCLPATAERPVPLVPRGAPVHGGAGQDGDGPPAWVLDANGRQVMPDFSDPATRQWWGHRIAALAERGAGGAIADFDVAVSGIEGLARIEVAGDPEMGGAGTLERYGGVFGLLAARSAFEGYGPEARDRRPLLVIPSTALGSQRWTSHRVTVGPAGVSTPEGLIAAALNSTMSAQPLVGASGLRAAAMSATEWEAMTGAAGFLPLWSVEDLPGADGEASGKELVRSIASVRRQLLPYWYTQTFSTFFQNQPLLRPLFLLDPADPTLRDESRAFLIGRDILVAPELGERTYRPEEAFPGQWQLLPLDEEHAHLPRVYMRRGSIIPLGERGRMPADWSLDPLLLAVALDDQGEAVGTLYEDEWDTYSLFRQQTRRITYRARREGETVMVRLGGLDGGWGMPRRVVNVRVLTPDGERTGRGSERGTIRVDLVRPPE
jgi:alpha-glucosidase